MESQSLCDGGDRLEADTTAKSVFAAFSCARLCTMAAATPSRPLSPFSTPEFTDAFTAKKPGPSTRSPGTSSTPCVSQSKSIFLTIALRWGRESIRLTPRRPHKALQQQLIERNGEVAALEARIAALLVERVEIGVDGLNVRLRVEGLSGLAREMLAGGIGEAA